MMQVKIDNLKWKAKDAQGNEKEDSTAEMLSHMVVDPQAKGDSAARKVNRIFRVIDEAKGKDSFEMDEGDFDYMVSQLKNNAPAFWGRSNDIIKAIDVFYKSKETKDD